MNRQKQKTNDKHTLPRVFFTRPVLEVAPELLGCFLVRRLSNGTLLRSRIIEVEAYDGEHDLASHVSKGKTKRTHVMYEEGGVWYVYLVYGMHHMLNMVTGTQDDPSAVLIRGVDDVVGPGKLTKYFAVDTACNGTIADPLYGNLWIEKGDSVVVPFVQTPRIGVLYAKEWAEAPYRFVLTK